MTVFGMIFTAIYIGFITLIRWESFPELLNIPLNEFGDFFAGVFGPLMLFWLILGYLQQKKELQQNTNALELQAEELKKSVEQHKELVLATKEQVRTEIEALELERIKAVREAHPHFNLVGAGLVGTSGEKKEYIIHILNSGQPASGVFFRTRPEINQINSYKVNYFETGKSVELTWDSLTSIEAPYELQLIINCKDSNTEPYTKTFHLLIDENQQYQLAKTTWVG